MELYQVSRALGQRHLVHSQSCRLQHGAGVGSGEVREGLVEAGWGGLGVSHSKGKGALLPFRPPHTQTALSIRAGFTGQ